ncbi:hypothetical protein HNR23_003426 [Nocardiopsis mwathae]|uniref:Ribosomal protein L7/L12 C-terminal domain-containing protein n=1 Tax=Nocardiopsis mwathae TaxID=1472723 RepID=A0A7W9YLJ2_9ACTN|nr:50S ribosomal protein L7/L12 [Nocardiopsis mwathae]MBB6173366.1 hypothetical protein [Nocardiopsis mwathae]
MAGLFGRSPKIPRDVVPLTEDAIAQARELVRQGKQINAVKVIREQSGMGLAEAKAMADALREGRQVPVAPAPGMSLADRVRRLRGEDRIADAVRLVATETGMTEAEAALFIEHLA